MERPTPAAVVFVGLLVFGSLAGVTATASASGDTVDREATVGTAPQQTTPTITIKQEYRLTPDQPGRIDVRVRYNVPDSVGEIRTALPTADAQNPRLDGFERTGDGEFVWKRAEQQTTSPALTYTVPANETGEVRGPEGTDGQFLFVDTGDWALVSRQPIAGTGYSYSGGTEPTVEYRNSTAGAGAVGGGMVFLGAHDEHTRSAHGQRFRLIVPETATLTEEPSDIFETVTAASNQLRVGDRDGSVLMIAAPTDVSWGVRGLQSGERDFYVRANETVDEPDNVWLHEYVHSRQDFRTTAATRWLTEATAQYYAAQLTLQQERTEFDQFSRYLGRGSNSRYSDVRLAEPATWHDGADYLKGGLVAGELDRRIRLATNGSASLQTVWRDLNRADGQVSQSELLSAVAEAGGDEPRQLARRYTERTDTPSVWSSQSHQEAFGTLPALFDFALPSVESDGFEVRGPYGTRTLTSGGLLTGETLVADVTVSNVGGKSGEYVLQVSRDGETVATRRGTLEPDETVVETVETTFTESGTHQLSTGEDSRQITVFDPVAPAVTDLAVQRNGDGDTFTVTATVENRLSRPSDGTVVIRRGGSTLTEESLQLGIGESTTLTATATLDEPGDYEFTAGEQTLTVTISESGSSNDGGVPGVSGPGFGVLATLLALLLAVGYRIE